MKEMLGVKEHPGLLSKELGEGLHREGSDGETSDYQRSTPSPRDAEAMALELQSEVLDKGDCPPSPPTHWGAKALQPDLGFVDYSDSSASSSSSLPPLPYSSQLDSHISHSLARLSSLSSHPNLLGKQLKVKLEKLPMPLVRGERKRSLLSSSSSTGGKKRKSQELVLSSSLFNSFRISKPKPLPTPPLQVLDSSYSLQEELRKSEEGIRSDYLKVQEEEKRSDEGISIPETPPPASPAPEWSLDNSPLPEEQASTPSSPFVVPRKLRFPCASSSTSGIVCKWRGCFMGFKTHGKLSDHIKVGPDHTSFLPILLLLLLLFSWLVLLSGGEVTLEISNVDEEK